MSTTEKIEQQLLERFGPLLTLDQLAQVLHRKPDGLAWTLSQRGPFACAINAAQVRLGRRRYFRASQLALVLGEGASDE